MGKVGTVIGIDLAGYSKERSNRIGIARLDSDGQLSWRTLRNKTPKIENTNEAILKYCSQYQPEIIAIDAPLGLPEGLIKMINTKIPIHESSGNYKKMFRRKCEFDEGIGCLESMMAKLTIRGMHFKLLASKILPKCKILEVYPEAALKQIRNNVKTHNTKIPIDFLILKASKICRTKIAIDHLQPIPNPHEVDSIVACLTGLIYLHGRLAGHLSNHSRVKKWYTPDWSRNYSSK